MVPVMANKDVLYWQHGNQVAYMVFTTDAILLASTSHILYTRLKATFDMYFAYKTCEDATLNFLIAGSYKENIG